MEKTREEFNVFIRAALSDRTSSAFEELYQFLVNTFIRADSTMTGRVRRVILMLIIIINLYIDQKKKLFSHPLAY